MRNDKWRKKETFIGFRFSETKGKLIADSNCEKQVISIGKWIKFERGLIKENGWEFFFFLPWLEAQLRVMKIRTKANENFVFKRRRHLLDFTPRHESWNELRKRIWKKVKCLHRGEISTKNISCSEFRDGNFSPPKHFITLFSHKKKSSK